MLKTWRPKARMRRSAFDATLRQIRRAHRLFQHELASRCDVSARTYLRWENRDSFPNLLQMTRLVRAIYDLDEEHAEKLAATRGTSLVTLGIVAPAPPPAPPSPPPAAPTPPPIPKDAIENAMYAAAEEIDVPPRRLRGPLAKLLQRLGALGVSVADASAIFDPESVTNFDPESVTTLRKSSKSK